MSAPFSHAEYMRAYHLPARLETARARLIRVEARKGYTRPSKRIRSYHSATARLAELEAFAQAIGAHWLLSPGASA